MRHKLAIKEADIALTIGDTFKLHRLGLLVVSRNRPSLEAYEACFAKLRLMHDCLQLWLGDLYVAVERDYGDDGFQIFDELDYTDRSITNFARVARSIPLERRRRELKYAHHESVAALPPEDQDRLLEEAVQKDLTVQQLRRRVREVGGADPKPSLGHELNRLIDAWRDEPSKAAPECARELGDLIANYHLE